MDMDNWSIIGSDLPSAALGLFFYAPVFFRSLSSIDNVGFCFFYQIYHQALMCVFGGRGGQGDASRILDLSDMTGSTMSMSIMIKMKAKKGKSRL